MLRDGGEEYGDGDWKSFMEIKKVSRRDSNPYGIDYQYFKKLSKQFIVKENLLAN